MDRLRTLVVVLGILNVVAAIASYVGAAFSLGFAWMGAFDLYAALDQNGVIDHEKLTEWDRALGEHYALGERLIDVPIRAGYQIARIGSVVLGVNGIALVAGGVLARRRRAERAVGAAS
jgi:hypothetical protein